VDDTTPRILVTGALGQIGSELTASLRERYGASSVFVSDCRRDPDASAASDDRFCCIDVTDRRALEEAVTTRGIDTLYHMAAVLSVVGERDPHRAWRVNVGGLENVLEVARTTGVRRLFLPSSIAVFGPQTPRDPAPQDTVLRPTTVYGVTKVTGELLGDYYVRRYGLDVRGLRYPGIISALTPPGGGTTDYAVAIFYDAITDRQHTCYLREDTVLPMMYMPDCIRATIDLMEADPERLRRHCDYNVAAMSFSAGELARQIAHHLPDFRYRFVPDERQAIADSWPRTIDDEAARHDWGWSPRYDLERMTRDMLERLTARRQRGELDGWPIPEAQSA
jgi:nucleoside-diphosphate-sugar epimerase